MPSSIECGCVAPPFTCIHTLCLFAVCLKVIALDCFTISSLCSHSTKLHVHPIHHNQSTTVLGQISLFPALHSSYLFSHQRALSSPAHLFSSPLSSSPFSSSLILIPLLLIFLLFYHHQTFLAGIIGTNVANMSLWIHGRTTKNLNWQIESSIKKWLALVRTCHVTV